MMMCEFAVLLLLLMKEFAKSETVPICTIEEYNYVNK